MLTIIASLDLGGVIGDHGRQLWKIRSDLIRFKHLTMGHTVIFGRKTYEEIGTPVLSGRKVIVFSRKNVNTIPQDDEVFVAGGGEIYKLFLPDCQKMYLTRINKHFNGDTYFPKIGKEWQMTEKSEILLDKKSNLEYWYETWIKTIQNSLSP